LTIRLDINVNKTKYMNTSRTRQQNADTRALDSNGKVHQEVTDIKYVGTVITSDDNCERDIKARMAAGNQSYHVLTRIMKSWKISKSIKLKMSRTMIRPTVMYGCERWTISEHN
jgi:hypothetical protein